MKRKIAIVGGGIIGCVTSLLLREKGHEVTIFEQNKNLGGVLQDYKINDDIFMMGCQYLDTKNVSFQLLKKYLPDVLHSFDSSYGSFTETQKNKYFTKKFAIPTLNIGPISEKDFKNYSDYKIVTLKDQINLYPNKVKNFLENFLKNCELKPEILPKTVNDNLQISRIYLIGQDKKIRELKSENFFDKILALSRDKIFDDKLVYSYPAKGYDYLFQELEKIFNKKNIIIRKKIKVKPIWDKKRLKLVINSNEESYDDILWTGNPTQLILNFNSKKIDSHIFRNIQISSNLKKSIKDNTFIQVFSEKSKILRIHLYRLNNEQKISIECINSKFSNEEILQEGKEILSNFDMNIELKPRCINKKIINRFDIFTLNDSKTINNFLDSTKKSNLLYSPWLIYGRENKMTKIIENLKQRNLI